MKRTVKKEEILIKWKITHSALYWTIINNWRVCCKSWKQTLDCFLISLHFKNCHCTVHKHLKQDNFENAKSDLWNCAYHGNNINCITTKHISKDFRKSHEIWTSYYKAFQRYSQKYTGGGFRRPGRWGLDRAKGSNEWMNKWMSEWMNEWKREALQENGLLCSRVFWNV